MSTPQKSLFSLLSLCHKFLQSVDNWQSSDKKYVCTVFCETRCIGDFVQILGSTFWALGGLDQNSKKNVL